MIRMIKRLAAAVPTPPADRVTIFVESSTGQPSYKKEDGTVSLLGTAGPPGTPADEALTWMTTAVGAASGAAPGGSGANAPGVLKAVSYNPGAGVAVTTTSATFANIDATNLAITFIVPASGKVLVHLTARAAADNNTELSWNLREAGVDVASTPAVAAYTATVPSVQNRISHTILVTGLSPGATKTYTWGQARTFGTGGATTLYGGTNGAAVLVVEDADPALSVATSTTPAPGLLATTFYNTPTTYTTVSNTLVDVDATNLAVTFVVPASGSVIVTLSALVNHTLDLTDSVTFGLREGSTDVADNFHTGNGTEARRTHARIRITGLTPGATKTYKWAFRRTAAGTASLFAGGANGPAALEVWDGNPSLSSGLVSGNVRPFKKTAYRGGANITTTSATLVDMDTTNLPALSLSLVVGDVVELTLAFTCYNTGHGNACGFDWLIDRPVSADIVLGSVLGEYAAAQYTQNGASWDTSQCIVRTFVATEAGTHTFKPQWRTSGGTLTIPYTGPYGRAVEHIVMNIGQAAV